MRSLARRLSRHSTIVVVYLLALIVFVVTTLAVNGFMDPSNLRTLSVELLVFALVAAGQCLVIVGGGIDLSAPGVLTGSAVLTASMVERGNDGLASTLLLVFALCVVVGVINGVGISYLGISPIVMTLAMSVALSGAIVLAVGTAPSSASPPAIENLAFGKIVGIPVSVPLLLLTLAIPSFLLTRTTFGRRLYAVGTSARVSRFSGIEPGPVAILSYVFSAVVAGVAGLVLLGYVGNAYLGMGDPYLFTAIAAVVVGGVSALGGSGHYLGAFAGVLLLLFLTKLLTALSVGTAALSILYGVTIIVSVWLTSQDVNVSRLRAALSKRRDAVS
jgi:ribose transport system permease protein